jgi:hypothetical protein
MPQFISVEFRQKLIGNRNNKGPQAGLYAHKFDYTACWIITFAALLVYWLI